MSEKIGDSGRQAESVAGYGAMVSHGDLPDDRRRPSRSRLSPQAPYFDEIVARHELALAEGRPRYLDPASGLWVFTAAYLWDRGSCCETGCRHCPYVER